MNAYFYLKQRQVQWARRHGIELVGSMGEHGEKAYTATLDKNLFRSLSQQARAEYNSGKGGELAANEKGIQKMQAVHSSAALTVNLFQYWRDLGIYSPIMEACGLPAGENVNLIYEGQLPIAERINRKIFPVDPHIDVVVRGRSSLIGIECKFTEAYSNYKHAGLKRPYLALKDLWQDIPACRSFAKSISPEDTDFHHLHPAQLLKHLLSLKHASKSKNQFRLLYLWYDVPFDKGSAHRMEIERFSDVVSPDGIFFKAITFQEVIISLAQKYRDEHRDYVDYISERYL